jgi:hypothetical protein
MYKVLNENCSPCLRESLVRLRELNRGHNLRNQETDLALPKTNFLKRSFKYSASVLWNNLPLDAKRATSGKGSWKKPPGKSHRALVPRMRHSLRLEFDHVEKTYQIFSVFIQIYTKL